MIMYLEHLSHTLGFGLFYLPLWSNLSPELASFRVFRAPAVLSIRGWDLSPQGIRLSKARFHQSPQDSFSWNIRLQLNSRRFAKFFQAWSLLVSSMWKGPQYIVFRYLHGIMIIVYPWASLTYSWVWTIFICLYEAIYLQNWLQKESSRLQPSSA